MQMPGVITIEQIVRGGNKTRWVLYVENIERKQIRVDSNVGIIQMGSLLVVRQ